MSLAMILSLVIYLVTSSWFKCCNLEPKSAASWWCYSGCSVVTDVVSNPGLLIRWLSSLSSRLYVETNVEHSFTLLRLLSATTPMIKSYNDQSHQHLDNATVTPSLSVTVTMTSIHRDKLQPNVPVLLLIPPNFTSSSGARALIKLGVSRRCCSWIF